MNTEKNTNKTTSDDQMAKIYSILSEIYQSNVNNINAQRRIDDLEKKLKIEREIEMTSYKTKSDALRRLNRATLDLSDDDMKKVDATRELFTKND